MELRMIAAWYPGNDWQLFTVSFLSFEDGVWTIFRLSVLKFEVLLWMEGMRGKI